MNTAETLSKENLLNDYKALLTDILEGIDYCSSGMELSDITVGHIKERCESKYEYLTGKPYQYDSCEDEEDEE